MVVSLCQSLVGLSDQLVFRRLTRCINPLNEFSASLPADFLSTSNNGITIERKWSVWAET